MKPKKSGRHNLLKEILTGLPLLKNQTKLLAPETTFAKDYSPSTGGDNPKSLDFLPHRIFGLILWISWFLWGFYSWWFTDVVIYEYLLATGIWLSTFLFSIFGTPIIRRKATRTE